LNTFCQGYEHEHNTLPRKILFPQLAPAITASSTSTSFQVPSLLHGSETQLPPLLYYGNGAPLLDRNLTLSRVAMHPIDSDKPAVPRSSTRPQPYPSLPYHHPPATLAESAPQSFRGALTNLQESTSVAFASSKRLQALVGERFHRLIPVSAQLKSAPIEVGDIECAPATKSLNATQNMLKKCIRFRARILHLHQSTPTRKAIFAGRGTARPTSCSRESLAGA
jgi:hypothetical protein